MYEAMHMGMTTAPLILGDFLFRIIGIQIANDSASDPHIDIF
jgi:hypothetical protein